jgi:hypothetical protein
VDPNWIIALSSVTTLVLGTVFGAYKFTVKVRGDREVKDEQRRRETHAQAEEALRIARDEGKAERTLAVEAHKELRDALVKQIAELQADNDNEERAREALQRRYEDLLREKGERRG